MPASLTNQIRLGFSLGWRIWTPNEVGFYAKTLAHSYFIFMVLKAKFFQKKLWVVNYSLFVGIRKYYVFIEFLQFGIKTKEERTYWKKIMYISLLVRHANYLSNARYTSNYEKLTAVKRYFNKQLGERLVSPRIKSGINLNIIKIIQKISKQGIKFPVMHKFNKIALNSTDCFAWSKKFIKTYKNFISRESLPENNENFPDALDNSVANIVGKTMYFEPYATRDITLSPIDKFKNYLKTDNVYNLELNNKITKTEISSEFSDYNEYLDNNVKLETVNQINLIPSIQTVATILQRDFKNKNLKIIPTLRKNNIKQQQELKWYKPNYITSYQVIESERNMDSTEKNFFKTSRVFLLETPRAGLRENTKMQYSICGGPRKRLFRNLKRSFQGKYIIKYANLVWFWEKISRLVTFYIISVNKNLR